MLLSDTDDPDWEGYDSGMSSGHNRILLSQTHDALFVTVSKQKTIPETSERKSLGYFFVWNVNVYISLAFCQFSKRQDGVNSWHFIAGMHLVSL